MPGRLEFYAHEEDAALLHQRLNEDAEIAFLLQDGPGHWRAVGQIDELQGKTMLWHVPGGPLPLLGRGPGEEDTLIEDPFAGWTVRSEGLDYSVPYFGPLWHSALLLEVYTPGWRGLEGDLLNISGLSHYGGYYEDRYPRKLLPSTQRWLRRFRDWMRRRAVRITRSGPLDGPNADIWALPAALRAIQAGMERSDWPFTVQSPIRPWRITFVQGEEGQTPTAFALHSTPTELK